MRRLAAALSVTLMTSAAVYRLTAAQTVAQPAPTPCACPSAPSGSAGSGAGGPATMATPSPAASDAPEKPKTPTELKAEAHYKRSRELYALGRYREAIAQLEAALRLDPTGAELLFNLGLVHEKLGEADEAIDAYTRYLQSLGKDADIEEKKKIAAAIKRLEGAKAELRAREALKTEHRFTPLSASMFALSGVTAIVTAVVGVNALAHDRQARDYVVNTESSIEGRDSLVRQSRREANWANVFGIASLLSLGTAITLYFTSSFPKADASPSTGLATSLRASVSPTLGGGAVKFEVTF